MFSSYEVKICINIPATEQIKPKLPRNAIFILVCSQNELWALAKICIFIASLILSLSISSY